MGGRLLCRSNIKELIPRAAGGAMDRTERQYVRLSSTVSTSEQSMTCSPPESLHAGRQAPMLPCVPVALAWKSSWVWRDFASCQA